MGFAFPKEERAVLVEAQPHRFHLPRPSDLRFNWVEADLAALDPEEAREFVVDAWRMVVPKGFPRLRSRPPRWPRLSRMPGQIPDRPHASLPTAA